MVPDMMAQEQEQIFKSYGAKTQSEYNAHYEHWFKEKTVAGEFSDFAYKTLNVDGWKSDPNYIPNWLPTDDAEIPESRKGGY